ncbi:MAG: hypothetical protein AAF928_17190, partial [Myxococcota bacterium]
RRGRPPVAAVGVRAVLRGAPPPAGGYGAPPGGFGYGGGPPGGAPKPAPSGPSRAAAAFKVLFFGVLFAGSIFGGVYGTAYQGYPNAFGGGLLAGFCAWGLVSGLAGVAGKRLSWAAVAGTVAVATLLCTAAGPTVSTAGRQREADRVYADLVDDDKPYASAWRIRYGSKYEPQFREPAWFGHYTRARVREAIDDKLAVTLRELMTEIDAYDAEDDETAELLVDARKDAEKAFEKIYATATAKMFAAVGDGKREFPVDPALRSAFATLLQGLTSSPDAFVHVAFVNQAQLDAPAGTDNVLRQMRRHPDAMASYPKGDAPVIEPGQAFSSAFDDRRRQTFITAMNESFHKVFDGDGLFTLVPLADDDDRKGKLVFEVSSTIARTDDFFFYEKGVGQGIKRFAGFLFAIEVEWGFRILDREGKALYAPEHIRTQPAESVRVRNRDSDPTWSMYSIMMDSAYYNYARRTVGSFGLEPPPEKKAFSYEGPI